MHIKNGIFSTLRAPIKTLLFILLLTVTILFVSVSVGSYRQTIDQLEQINDQYTSIAVIDYTGGAYPDVSAIDKTVYSEMQNFDRGIIKNDPSVLDFYPEISGICITDGYKKNSTGTVYEDYAVIKVKVLIDRNYKGLAYVEITDTLAASKYHGTVFIDTSNYPDLTLAKGHEYLLHGRYNYGLSSVYTLTLAPFDSEEKFGDIPISDYLPYVDVTGIDQADYSKEANALVVEARFYNYYNSCLDYKAIYSTSLSEEFQQSIIYTDSGRSFTDEELSGDSRVCMISGALASLLNMKAGDKLGITPMTKKPESPVTDSLITDNIEMVEYTIIGTFTGDEVYKYVIYLPAGAFTNASTSGYTIGTARIRNGETDEFSERMKEKLPDTYSIRVHDEGYALAVAPYESLCRTELIILLISVFIGAAVTGVFVYLLIIRQRHTAKTMSDLGTSRGCILLYLLTGAGVSAIPAAVLGGIISSYLQEDFFLYLFERAKGAQPVNLDYSNSKLGVIKEYMLSIVNHPWLCAAVSAVCLLCIVLMCIVGALVIFRHPGQKAPKKEKKNVKVRSIHVSTVRAGALRYSLISIRRNFVRSLIVVLTVAAIASLLCALSFAENESETQLDNIMNGSYKMTGCFTSALGIYRDNLAIRSTYVAELYQTGYVDSVAVTIKTKCYYAGTNPYHPTDLWEVEAYTYSLRTRGDNLIFTSDIYESPEFYGKEPPAIKFFEGFSMKDFTEKTGICVVPETYLTENNLSLGDTLPLVILLNNNGKWNVYDDQYTIVGTYAKTGSVNNIYVSITEKVDMDSDIYNYVAPDPNARYTKETRTNISVYPVNEVFENDVALKTVTWEGKQYFYPEDSITVTLTDSSGQSVKLPQKWVTVSIYYIETDTYTGRYTEAGICTNSTVWQTSSLYQEIEEVTLCGIKMYYPKDVAVTYVSQLDMMLPRLWVVKPYIGYGEPTAKPQTYKTLSSASFTLKNISDMDSFRSALGTAGFGEASDMITLKSFVMINDRDYNDLVKTLKENMHYLTLISKAILILAVGISFLVSYLLTNGRKQEMAALRSLGTSRGRVFFIFFSEQLILLLLTTGAVFGIFTALFGFSYQILMFISGFIVCYLTGCILSLIIIGGRRILGLLAEKE